MQAIQRWLLVRSVMACAMVLSMPVVAQSPSRLTGSLRAQFPGDDGSLQVTFTCDGNSTCTGVFKAAERAPGCINNIATVNSIVVSGLDLSNPGPIAGGITLKNFEFDDKKNPDGTCSVKAGEDRDASLSFTGFWNGSSSALVIQPVVDRRGRILQFSGSIATDIVPPVFNLVAAGRADATAANFTSTIQYRQEDLGTTGSVYVFAVAPAVVVKAALAKEAFLPIAYARAPDGGKDAALSCVLAQLTSTGQLQAVSASSLQAYVTGVFTAAGQAVTLINGVATANIGGATFYVGYGSSAATMLSAGLNRNVVTVPGALTCQPQAPQTGWWWNPREGGRGYSIEVQGNHIFFAAFHYDASGRSTWNVASGNTSLDGSLFTGNLLSIAGGQTLGGPYNGFPQVSTLGAITLAFNDAARGTMIWPGGTVPIERMNIIPNGLAAAPKANQPESGWWWNPQESGRGFFIEWQDGWADLAGYMYDDAGNPVWYISVFETPNIRQFNGAWWSYANGQSMGGAYKAPAQTSNNVAPVTVQFSGPDTAIMTLPNGRTTTLARQRF